MKSSSGAVSHKALLYQFPLGAMEVLELLKRNKTLLAEEDNNNKIKIACFEYEIVESTKINILIESIATDQSSHKYIYPLCVYMYLYISHIHINTFTYIYKINQETLS